MFALRGKVIRELEGEIDKQLRDGKNNIDVRLVYMPYCIFYEMYSLTSTKRELVAEGKIPFRMSFLRSIKKAAESVRDYFADRGIHVQIKKTNCYIHPIR